MKNNRHDFPFFVANNFLIQIENRLSELGWSQSMLREKMEMPVGSISHIFRNPECLTFDIMIRLARTVGLKLCVVAYDDSDPEKGPVNPEIFRMCWEKLNRPTAHWQLEDNDGVRSFPVRDFQPASVCETSYRPRSPQK